MVLAAGAARGFAFLPSNKISHDVKPLEAWKVLRSYNALRWYLVACLCKDAGTWLVRLANLIVVQQWAGTGAALSHLVLCSLLPKAVFDPLGGMLSDIYDRRHLMIVLDAMSGTVVLGLLVALEYQSVPILFVVTATRSAIAAVPYPVAHGFLPLIVPEAQDLQYAGTLVTSSFGFMSMIGGLVAGSTTMLLGLKACYALDTVSYFISCMTMLLCVSGNFRARGNYLLETTGEPRDEEEADTATVVSSVSNVLSVPDEHGKTPRNWCGWCKNVCVGCWDVIFCGSRRMFVYLATRGCFMLVFLKPTAALLWGPADIIGVEIATVRKANGMEDEKASSYRMGLYYCFSGLGVFVGPSMANLISDAKKPATLQRSCCMAIFVTVTGWIMAGFTPTFHWYLLASWWSGIGYGTLWAYSSLLLQLLVESGMLGRVFSIEFVFFVLAESFSSSITGPLYDAGLSTQHLCFWGAGLGLISFLFWTTFHMYRGGAAHPRFNPTSEQQQQQQLLSKSKKTTNMNDDDDDDPGMIAASVDLPTQEKANKKKDNSDGEDLQQQVSRLALPASEESHSLQEYKPDDDKSSVSRRKGASVK